MEIDNGTMHLFRGNSDIGRMAEVRNVAHLALQGVSMVFVLIG